MASRRLRDVLAVVAAGALAGALAATAAAADPTPQRVDASVRYLQAVQNADGGFGGRPGAASDPIFTSWAALALAAAGINPRDQALPGGRDAITYLRRSAGRLSVTTDFERTLMVAVAAGVDPRRFGGHDLVESIVSRQLPDGSFPQAPDGTAAVNATAFGIIALAQVAEPGLEGRIQRATAWLEQVADADGGYGWIPRGAGEADMTAAAIQALRAAGRADTPAERRALAFLRGVQNDDGGFPMRRGGESNSPSTAWALQALWAAGEDPRRWARSGGTPLDYLASMQQGDGSVRQSSTDDANRVWVTAYAVPALAGRPLPIRPVPRKPVERRPLDAPSEQRAAAPSPTPAAGRQAGRRPGPTGEGRAAGGGVVYGGGGRGAPLYSRPRADGGGRRNAAARQGGDGAGRRSARGAGHGPGRARVDAPATPREPARAATVRGDLIGTDARGSAPVRAERLRSAGGGDGAGALILLGGLGACALGGALVERRRPPTRVLAP